MSAPSSGPDAKSSTSSTRPTRAASTGAAPRALREPGTLQRVLCSTLAWSVTVAPSAFSRSAGAAARIAAVGAILAALAGPTVATRYRRIGRHLGLSVFLALSLATWLLAPTTIDPTRIDSVRAAIGAAAWGVFAFSWGEPWTGFGGAEQRADGDPFAAPLRARATLAPYAVPIATIGVVSSLVMLLGVWQIHEASRALIAQAAAIGIGVAVVTAGANVAVSRGKERPKGERRVSSAFVRSLVLLAIVAVAGAVLLALRP